MMAISVLFKEFGISDTFSGLAATLATWRARERQRRDLARLDARLRRDIGVTAEDVAVERNKSIWQA
jgi:uncharacterized protein YjiS (DUF1127 family)